MSDRYEDEEEDELQRILEGRDVEDEPSDDHYRHVDHHRVETIDSHHRSEPNVDIIRDKSINKQKSNKRRIDYDLEENSNDDSNEEQNAAISDDKTDLNEARIKVKVRRVVTKPLPKLNADKLMTKSGIAELAQLFKDFKFNGNGNELKDLNQLMFKLSHWAHRLFPSLTFDDFIEKCETLGNKRNLKTFVNKIRYDLPLNLDPNEEVIEQNSDKEDNELDNNAVTETIANDFDTIIGNLQTNIDPNIETNENQVLNGSELIDKEIANELEMSDYLSEEEVIRQINSSDEQTNE